MNLLKISLVISIIGIFFLFFISNLIQPKQVSSYEELKLNELVQTSGKIISIQNYDEFSVIKIDNNLTITCDKCKFQTNQTIQARGKIREYKNQLQIQAERIQRTG